MTNCQQHCHGKFHSRSKSHHPSPPTWSMTWRLQIKTTCMQEEGRRLYFVTMHCVVDMVVYEYVIYVWHPASVDKQNLCPEKKGIVVYTWRRKHVEWLRPRRV
jgi:hypothetical protein